MSGALQLAWRYVSRHAGSSLLLAITLGVVIALPIAVRSLVHTLQHELRARALSTPLVAGPPGSATDLVLSALHFRPSAATLTLASCDAVRDTGLAEVIPLHTRFKAGAAPIVGTELDYFPLRGLKLASGQMITRLGDCVIGANVKHEGDHIFSSPEQVFDIAGVYPLKMRITGKLAATGTPDDDAVFVDLRTAWLIEGLAHGHEDLATTTDPKAVLKKEGDTVIGSKAVMMFNEVTDKNIASFHFHGEDSTLPIHAMIVIPHDERSGTILTGRYPAGSAMQMLRPSDVMETLLQTLFRVENVVITALSIVAVAALLIVVLVFVLSFRLRRAEFASLEAIGISARTLRSVKLAEVGCIALTALAIAAVSVRVAAWVLVQREWL